MHFFAPTLSYFFRNFYFRRRAFYDIKIRESFFGVCKLSKKRTVTHTEIVKHLDFFFIFRLMIFIL